MNYVSIPSLTNLVTRLNRQLGSERVEIDFDGRNTVMLIVDGKKDEMICGVRSEIFNILVSQLTS